MNYIQHITNTCTTRISEIKRNLPANSRNLSRSRVQNLGPVPRSRKSNVSRRQIDTLGTRISLSQHPPRSEGQRSVIIDAKFTKTDWFIRGNARGQERRMSTGNV